MDKFVIFSKPVVWILLSVIVLLYVADVVLSKYISKLRASLADKEAGSDAESLGVEYYQSLINVNKIQMISHVIAGINIAVHVGEFVCMLLIKATPAEILFLLMISSALVLTANRIKGE